MTEAAPCECGHRRWTHGVHFSRCWYRFSEDKFCPCPAYQPAEAAEGAG